jgi:hypothetical protein
MDLRRFGLDRAVGSVMFVVGLILASVYGANIGGRDPLDAGGRFVGILPSDLYLLLAASLIWGSSLPLLIRGRARRPLTILLAVETPFVVWIAISMVQSLPN